MLMLVHPSPTLLNGIATICCRDEFFCFAGLKKISSSPEAARSHQQGSLLHAAVFSRASLSSWSMENKLTKMSPENQITAASLTIQKPRDSAGDTERRQEVWWITWRSQTKAFGSIQWGPDLQGEGSGYRSMLFLLLLTSRSQPGPALGGREHVI